MTDYLEHQRRLKTAILERIQDLTSDEHISAALIETGFDILAARHLPSRLSAADRTAIRESYPAATPVLIAVRSLDEEGLKEAVGVAGR